MWKLPAHQRVFSRKVGSYTESPERDNEMSDWLQLTARDTCY